MSIFSQLLKGPLQIIKITLHIVWVLCVSIVLQKHYFHGIYAFSKKRLILRVLVRSLKESNFTRYEC